MSDSSEVKWHYVRVGYMGQLVFRIRRCDRCSAETDELYKRIVMSEDSYRRPYERWVQSYCKSCIEALWTIDDMEGMVL